MSKEQTGKILGYGVTGETISIKQAVGIDNALQLNIDWGHYANFKSLYDMAGIHLEELDAVAGILGNIAQKRIFVG